MKSWQWGRLFCPSLPRFCMKGWPAGDTGPQQANLPDASPCPETESYSISWGWNKTKGAFVPWNSEKYLSLCQPWLFFKTFQELNTFFFYHLQNYLCLNPVMYSFKKRKEGNLYFHKPSQPFRNAHLYFPWAVWSNDYIWHLPFVQAALHIATKILAFYLHSTPLSPS